MHPPTDTNIAKGKASGNRSQQKDQGSLLRAGRTPRCRKAGSMARRFVQGSEIDGGRDKSDPVRCETRETIGQVVAKMILVKKNVDQQLCPVTRSAVEVVHPAEIPSYMQTLNLQPVCFSHVA